MTCCPFAEMGQVLSALLFSYWGVSSDDADPDRGATFESVSGGLCEPLQTSMIQWVWIAISCINCGTRLV
jgi:hypothetical protein